MDVRLTPALVAGPLCCLIVVAAIVVGIVLFVQRSQRGK
jgi:hypothetical protein